MANFAQQHNSMAEQIPAEQFLKKSEQIPIIDVRSPAEYELGHIPGAINLPIFDNEERAKVGTRYKQAGRDFAIQLGLEFVGPKLAEFSKQARKIAKSNQLLVHCWRGGMRSQNMAWLFELIGIKVEVLRAGYKGYRAYIREQLGADIPIIILGGSTGSGKTDILKELELLGEQFIDLEGIAHHKGSAFGAIGEKDQPSNEQFENNLAKEWLKLDFNRAVWLEDESITMGKCGIPFALYKRMRDARVIKVDIPKKVREERLVKEYANGDTEGLRNALERISKKLGGLRAKQAFDALEAKDFITVADISLQYYDKAYSFGIAKRDQKKIIEIPIEEDHPVETAKRILKLIQNKD